jgi:hypothetical protein
MWKKNYFLFYYLILFAFLTIKLNFSFLWEKKKNGNSVLKKKKKNKFIELNKKN